MIQFSIAFTLLCITASSTFAETIMLRRAPSEVNNPLKGLVPYSRPTPGRFEHSMEFSYLGLAAVMTGEDQYDWVPLESMLDDIASRGNQTVFRIFLEYPNKANVIPQFLIDKGLTVHKYVNTNTAPLPPSPVETPDYENTDLRRALKNFVAALGRRYDGDPRIAYITAGLLGTWGEWHYIPALESSGEGAKNKWKTQPIGGEIRPEAWGKVFDQDPSDANIQDLKRVSEKPTQRG